MLVESSGTIARSSNRATTEFRSEKIREQRRRKFFRVVAKHCYPSKTAPEVHNLTDIPESTIYDWLKGKSDAPGWVFMALFGEIARD